MPFPPARSSFPAAAGRGGTERDPEVIADFIARDMPLGRFGTPEEIANVCVFLCSPLASLVTGANIAVDGCQLSPSV